MGTDGAVRGKLSVTRPVPCHEGIKVIKDGNELTISFITALDRNNLNLKKSQIEFIFVDGVSPDHSTNDFFTNICRCI